MKTLDFGNAGQENPDLLKVIAVIIVIAVTIISLRVWGEWFFFGEKLERQSLALEPPENFKATPIAEENDIFLKVSSGRIQAGDWEYSISLTRGSYYWITGEENLEPPGVTIATCKNPRTYYVSLRFKAQGLEHVYFSDNEVTIEKYKDPFVNWNKETKNITDSQELNILSQKGTRIVKRENPKFGKIQGFIENSNFIMSCDTPPPYAIDYSLRFEFDRGKEIRMDYSGDNLLWLRGLSSGENVVYRGSVNPELERILDDMFASN